MSSTFTTYHQKQRKEKTMNISDNEVQDIRNWVLDWESREEHDLDFTIELKDSAYSIFINILKQVDKN